jgi:hypothetical protein
MRTGTVDECRLAAPGSFAVGLASRFGISGAAVIAAARHGCDDIDLTSRRLYRFNETPWTPADAALFGSPAGRNLLLAQSGLRGGGGGTGYRFSDQRHGWSYWRRIGLASRTERVSARKVYLTPHLFELSTAVRRLQVVAHDLEVPIFKIGADHENLRRPDRIVVYVQDETVARELSRRLRSDEWTLDPVDLPFAERLAHGVYTGVDPRDLADGRRGRSWRSWVCRRLARRLHYGRPGDASDALCVLATELADLGVDPADWRVPDDYFARFSR